MKKEGQYDKMTHIFILHDHESHKSFKERRLTDRQTDRQTMNWTDCGKGIAIVVVTGKRPSLKQTSYNRQRT